MAIVRNCEFCKVEITRNTRKAFWQYEKQQFCSKYCKGKSQGFQKKLQPSKNCNVCNRTYTKSSTQPNIWWKKSKYCSQSCYNIARTPEVMLPRYRGAENQRWRKLVLKRDRYKCKMDNEFCSSKLEVHHILRYTEYPELANDANNGITLCTFHHPRKKEEEKRLENKFKELIWQL